MSNKKVPNSTFAGKGKKIIQKEDPSKYYQRKASWAFHRICCNPENDMPISVDNWKQWETEILPKLIEFQERTWADILSERKEGRNGGNKHHNVPISGLTDLGKDLLKNLNICCDEVFSLRLAGKKRIIGILDMGVLNILFYDTDHKFVVSNKRHT